MLSNGLVRQYLLVDQNNLTLIDTGLAGNSRAVLKAVQGLGFGPEAVTRILITHADGDHYGALADLTTRTHAQSYAAALEAQAMQNGASSRPLQPRGLEKLLYGFISPLFKSPPTAIDQILKPGDVLPVLGGLQVLDTHGHTPGHLSFYLPEERVLFAGDSIAFIKGRPVPSFGANTWNPDASRRSFDMQMNLSPRIICAGHGFYQG